MHFVTASLSDDVNDADDAVDNDLHVNDKYDTVLRSGEVDPDPLRMKL